ncbi:MAG: putative TetR-family transcriptional regulator, partial [Chloroflexi bacterium]|nr:putative TetR-family transcriptional regulator [Chloroflexota bacterium]
RESHALPTCREAVYEAGEPLLTSAQRAGQARGDTTIDDVMRLVIGITAVAFQDAEQRERVLKMALDGIRRR